MISISYLPERCQSHFENHKKGIWTLFDSQRVFCYRVLPGGEAGKEISCNLWESFLER
ncbi:hypothetical cytosolic protein [Syntrophus aciditrophicus SB]|uniref:Hypothetical cytosolic protein n=1 Tax=Syntrophus aciditrophicus (strain SB) TaxID=56780 RepID=Q2LVG4_SYNAS|nr:hypothetical cytosolic protein [Syntrophus aciditrophicus SB]